MNGANNWLVKGLTEEAAAAGKGKLGFESGAMRSTACVMRRGVRLVVSSAGQQLTSHSHFRLTYDPTLIITYIAPPLPHLYLIGANLIP